MQRRSNRGRAAIAVSAGLLCAAATFAGLDALSPDAGQAERSTVPAPAADAGAGMRVFVRAGCASCHTLAAANSSGLIGPELDSRLARHTRASLREKILDPYPGGEQGVMPGDYRKRLAPAELDALLDFLVAAGARRP